jgi:SAM-dependent methyltransferase
MSARDAGDEAAARHDSVGDTAARQDSAGDAHATLPPEARAANLELWNRWTAIHEKSAFYDVEGFRAGASSLWPLERDELGPFIHEGTTLLHLQCHFGLDTLSWARLGARVVGLDFSDEAIALARRLADEVGLSGRAEFVCADLYDADAHLGDRLFDVVFVSWGAIEWLPDLERWAGVVARHLAPGGTFYMAEIHPFASALDEVPGKHDVRVKYRLLPAPDQPYADPVQGSYADSGADTSGLVAYGWNHSFAEIIGALTGAGLRLEHLHEFPTSPAPFWDWMIRDDDRWWWLPDGKGGRRKDLPFSYSLRASKPAEGEA